MKDIGASLLVKTVNGLIANTIQEQPQYNSTNALQKELHHAPKIFTENCKIELSKTVGEVHNLIRGLSPFPGAFTYLNGKMMKVFKSEKEINPTAATVTDGYKTDGKSYLKFACADGFIHVKELQMEGKKRMLVEDFLKGFRP
jgi:methionyl-tRNA formyltransferase